MPRYFIRLAYQGKNYHGWQSQQNASSVQDELEKCLSLKLSAKIRLTGCGRTDTGVHAQTYYAHADWDRELSREELAVLTEQLNVFLPDDIVVYAIVQVPADAHARFDAVSRSYRYIISRKKDPFMLEGSWYVYGPIDVALMQQAAAILFEYTDFTSFSKLHSSTKTNDCSIMAATWTEANDQLIFTITADRFLRNMVRSIVGTMLEIGKGKMSLTEFRKVIEAKNRAAAGLSVPAKGLYLYHVAYPFELSEAASTTIN